MPYRSNLIISISYNSSSLNFRACSSLYIWMYTHTSSCWCYRFTDHPMHINNELTLRWNIIHYSSLYTAFSGLWIRQLVLEIYCRNLYFNNNSVKFPQGQLRPVSPLISGYNEYEPSLVKSYIYFHFCRTKKGTKVLGYCWLTLSRASPAPGGSLQLFPGELHKDYAAGWHYH